MSASMSTTLSAILGQSSEAQTPVVPRSCPECQGKGFITLLVTHARCSACNGTGRPNGGELDQHVATIGLSIRAIQGLARIGVMTLRQAAKLSDRDLLAAPGMDAACLEKLKTAMRRMGIRYGEAA